MPKRELRRCDAEFKQNTASLYFSSGKSCKILFEELNVPSPTIACWINSGKYYHSQSKNLPNVTHEELSELEKLRQELKHVKGKKRSKTVESQKNNF